MKFYIAASFPRRLEANSLGIHLMAAGHEVTSLWHMSDRDYDPSDVKAERDFQGIKQCEHLLMLTGDTLTHGGRHTEFGIALALGKLCTVIGPRESVFQNLGFVGCFGSVEDFLGFLGGPLDCERRWGVPKYEPK